MTTDPEAIGVAVEAANRADFEAAVALLRPLAAKGNAEAQYQLGSLALTECELISGREAFSLFRAAADQGHSEAMYHVATFPEFPGEPFTSSLSTQETWTWLLRAAESGCVEAQYNAGASLATGQWRDGAVAQDLEGAVGWYRRAAEAGHVLAQFNFATMLMNGEGCTRDVTAARHWLERALAGGDPQAQMLLDQLDSIE